MRVNIVTKEQHTHMPKIPMLEKLIVTCLHHSLRQEFLNTCTRYVAEDTMDKFVKSGYLNPWSQINC